MKFDKEKQRSVKMYILKKIEAGIPSLSRTVADALDISQNTVHTYLKELLAEGIITRVSRGCYRLTERQYTYRLFRSKGELASDTYAFTTYVLPLMQALPDNVRRIWDYAFSEMVNNVMDHSEAESLTIRITQSYLRTQTVLLDDGIGIFRKICDHFCFTELDEAICELFKGKLTTDTANHSGEGIFFTSRMMDSFAIVSDDKIFATTKFNDGVLCEDCEGSKGTAVIMSLSNFTHRTAAEVFDLYTDEVGLFEKTRIPLKNIFDAAPVSRSQAKRITQRLDQFSEVTLDFAEIPWIGQGFAHQLFVVYARAKPDVILIPVNMCEAVEKMYRHVTATR